MSFDLDAAGTPIQLTGAASTPGALAYTKPGLYAIEYSGYISLVVISTTAVTELVSSVRKPVSTTDNTYTATNGTGTITVGTSQAADSKPNIWVASSILYIGMGTSGSSATTVRVSRIF